MLVVAARPGLEVLGLRDRDAVASALTREAQVLRRVAAEEDPRDHRLRSMEPRVRYHSSWPSRHPAMYPATSTSTP